MNRLPTLVVVTPASAPPLVEALERLGEVTQVVSAQEAGDAILKGTARLVFCERVAGWHALAMRVDHGGGVLVVWGHVLDETDRRGLLPGHLLSCPGMDALPQILTAAHLLVDERSARRKQQSAPAETTAQVSRVVQRLAAQLDLKALADEARSQVRDLCKADVCELWVVDENTGAFFTPGHGASLTIQPGQGLVGKAATDGNQAVVHGEMLDAAEDPRPPDDRGLPCQAVVIPLVHRGDVLGALQLIRPGSSAGFSENELKALVGLAPHVAIALQNAHLTRGLLEAQNSMLSTNAELERRVQERTTMIVRAKREWEQTFDAIEEPIALQTGFKLKRANRAYAKRVGVKITEVPGSTCHELLAGRSTPCAGCPLLRDEGGLRGEISPRPGWYFEFTGFHLPTDDGNPSVVIHYRDVAPQKALEARLRESERMASLGQLASGAAHEINNPLGFVSSNLNSLKEAIQDVIDGLEKASGSDTAQRLLAAGEIRDLMTDGGDMIREALEGADRVARIVQALRELSRLEIGHVELSNVNASVERALRSELGLEASRVNLKLESVDRANVQPLQLDRAVAHVVRNAQQAVSRPEDITVRTSDDGAHIRIAITDKGTGIPAENVHRVFEPFFTTRGIGKGIGLGLTAAYGIVARAGGTIEVQSEKGVGSTFSILLPRVRPEEAAPPMDPKFLAVS